MDRLQVLNEWFDEFGFDIRPLSIHSGDHDTMDEWLAALNAADVEKTLRSRGVDASTLSGGSGKDMELIHRVAGSFNAVFRVRNSFPLQNTCYADPSPGRSQVHVCCEPADDH